MAVCDADADAVAGFAARTGLRAAVSDVTDGAAMADFLGAIERDWGGADVMISNAGTGGPAGRIEDIAFDEWRACLSVNLDGAFHAAGWAARVMRREGRGVILFTASTSGLFGHPERSPYAVAKWGIVGLMKTLAMELGPDGIRVNAICPGAVEGARMERMLANEARARGGDPEEIRAAYVRGTSLRTWVTADDVAEMALFLASPAAARITGQAMAVDGHTEAMR